ncbi:hypothetical protein LNKW23_05200 [Paralimibaculum aggregatum]|uniref:PepSY domain-containing protein n=1 Tax=Paralimibaculum aggregatum TaxID=3036245 RepID=A0ABQ6LI40_9RHOB|nr:PepSY domain-containing protein [Limibaculum sp. NKW23]GMG81307.1 hypothetical protein LNKW23_05200 [Limibaculum sp. NKW23]
MKPAIIALVATLSAALPAAAQDGAKPALSTVIAGLEADGYRVTEVDVDRDAIEVEAVTPDSRRVELRIDPATGKILSETPDD